MTAVPAGARERQTSPCKPEAEWPHAARREGAIWPGYRSLYQLHPGHLQHACSACDWIDQILVLPIDQVEGGDVIPPDTIVRVIHRLLLPVDFHIAFVVRTVFGVVDLQIVEAVQLIRRHPHVALPDRLEFDVRPAAADDDPQVTVRDQRPGAGEEPHRRVPVHGNPQTGLVILRHGLLLDGTAGSAALRYRAFNSSPAVIRPQLAMGVETLLIFPILDLGFAARSFDEDQHVQRHALSLQEVGHDAGDHHLLGAVQEGDIAARHVQDEVAFLVQVGVHLVQSALDVRSGANPHLHAVSEWHTYGPADGSVRNGQSGSGAWAPWR